MVNTICTMYTIIKIKINYLNKLKKNNLREIYRLALVNYTQ